MQGVGNIKQILESKLSKNSNNRGRMMNTTLYQTGGASGPGGASEQRVKITINQTNIDYSNLSIQSPSNQHSMV